MSSAGDSEAGKAEESPKLQEDPPKLGGMSNIIKDALLGNTDDGENKNEKSDKEEEAKHESSGNDFVDAKSDDEESGKPKEEENDDLIKQNEKEESDMVVDDPLESPKSQQELLNKDIANNEENENKEHEENNSTNRTEHDEEKEQEQEKQGSDKASHSSSKVSTQRTEEDSHEDQDQQEPQEDPNEPPEEEIEAALELILEGADPSQGFDKIMLQKVTERLYKMKNEAHAQSKYLEAEQYSQLMKNCQKASDVAGFSDQCASQINEIVEKRDDAQYVVDSLKEKWENQFQMFEDVISEKLEELRKKHTSELSEFDSNIPEELPPKYRKHSVEYIQLRKKERLLARNQEFAEAQKIKVKADRLEDEENMKQYMKLQDDLQNQRDALVDRQNRQLDLFGQWVNEKRHMMLMSRDKDMAGPVRRLQHYTAELERLEERGLPPNPYFGYTTNRISQKDSIRAVRTAAATPMERSTKRREREELPASFRPTSSMSLSRRSAMSTSAAKRKQIVTPSSSTSGRR